MVNNKLLLDNLGVSDILKEKHIRISDLHSNYANFFIQRINSFLSKPLYKAINIEDVDQLNFLSKDEDFKDYMLETIYIIQNHLKSSSLKILKLITEIEDETIKISDLKAKVHIDNDTLFFILDSLKNSGEIFDYNPKILTK